MDPTLVSQPGGFYGWILQYGQVIAFIAQMVYWMGILVLLGYAVWQYKRWVNFQLGTGRSGKLREGESESVDVNEFVD
jgi:hypothetical protein